MNTTRRLVWLAYLTVTILFNYFVTLPVAAHVMPDPSIAGVLLGCAWSLIAAWFFSEIADEVIDHLEREK
jgi:hypothetical protein